MVCMLLLYKLFESLLHAFPFHSLLLISPLSSALLIREGHHSGTNLPVEHELHERLLDLLCRLSPQLILNFLQTSQHYRLEEALQALSNNNFFNRVCLCQRSISASLCLHHIFLIAFLLMTYSQIVQKYHHNEASAYLLEKKGDFQGAFAVLLEVSQLTKADVHM